MKVSYNWLNEFLNGKAPKVEKLAELLDMHSMEVESIEKVGNDFVVDAKATPNLNHSCLCHRGIAREIATIADIKVSKYSREFKDFQIVKTNKNLEIKIADGKLCPRYIGRIIENVKVGPSPKWLAEKLEILGQRSINNVVDATNFVMLEIGQPMHAFDADKIEGNLNIRRANKGEQIDLLRTEIMAKGGIPADHARKILLDEYNLIIADDKEPLALAGIKGGIKAELNNKTTNIFLESANFDPILIRKTAASVENTNGRN